jgi:hypothetical protein
MYRIELTSPTRLFTATHSWAHPRAGAIPPRTCGNNSDSPVVVMTLQTIHLDFSDVFSDLYVMHTEDLGECWTSPEQDPAFQRRYTADGAEVAVCDFTPAWHAASGKLLGTGQTVKYIGKTKIPKVRTREVAYAFYDAIKRCWEPWRTLALPDYPQFANAGAGSAQRLDLPNGDILLPIYFRKPECVQYSTTVARCRVENGGLHYLEHGTELTISVERGFVEPSITCFQGRYYLTLRNDQSGYVAVSEDGLHYGEPHPWCWEDGTNLGNYNTQQHWVNAGGKLFLVYTRRGADNDHVFRHRAPLFMSEVNPQTLRVIRSTEKILMPNRGARLGNFAVTYVSANEVWVTAAEWMQRRGCEQYGSDGSVWVTRLHFPT